MTDDTTWTIAQMADDFDVTHRALRHYEQLGLLSPEREGQRRIYSRRERTRLALILRGRRLGFPLEEVATILDMYDDQPGEAGQLRYLLSQIGERRAELQRRLRDVQDGLRELEELEKRCEEDLERLA
ncbi:MerR family transcriptional regulator [Ornithinimicrobium tianjinense]|uniref:Liu genes regulator n=1 Tax=Ornithinimicrobium tianjinense TaxID=1195761 RepID=A0A917BPJ8_9MICO|nr:MerR family DNA-binding transcriptional regulator [Ornithinimicrobium tianjinense]GGF51305.1 liu genes regulator [Ornithinimicrobium tianjinense]